MPCRQAGGRQGYGEHKKLYPDINIGTVSNAGPEGIVPLSGIGDLSFLAGSRGFEPRSGLLESSILPLNYDPK